MSHRNELEPPVSCFATTCQISCVLGICVFPTITLADPPIALKPEPTPNHSVAKNPAPDKKLVGLWKPLPGKWTACQYGGDGEIQIKENHISVKRGDPLTAVFWEKKEDGDSLVRDNYELKLKAKRTDGLDFFCGLTFPIADQYATLVLGGWGGGITGLSSIDGRDASENETTMFREYDNDRWYDVRVRVTPSHVQCWVDDQSVVKIARAGRQFGLRFEMDLCEPLGIAAYLCDAEYEDIGWRYLSGTDLGGSELKAEEAKKQRAHNQ